MVEEAFLIFISDITNLNVIYWKNLNFIYSCRGQAKLRLISSNKLGYGGAGRPSDALQHINILKDPLGPNLFW